LLLGTKKGVFLAESDARRDAWQVCGPLTSGTWSIYHVGFGGDAAGDGGTIYAGGASNWYGPAVWQSPDLGQAWTHSSEGLTYTGDTGDEAGGASNGPEITQVWCVTRAHGVLYAGVEPAGLFKSEDGGATWAHAAGLREHPSRPTWRETGGGLCLHTILAHPTDPQQLWVGVSSGGVFHTRNGGATWDRRASVVTDGASGAVGGAASGGRLAGEPPAQAIEPVRDLHPCVHALALAPHDPSAGSAGGRASGAGVRLYQQNHDGVYRSDDGGRGWQDVSAGLPSRFGFPLAVHPRDAETLYVVPLESDAPGRRYVPGGQMAVWRSRDGGAHWQPLTGGLPRERTSLGVLRGALALDSLQPAGVYVGTTTGQVYWSADEGDTWRTVPARLPPIYSVAVAAV
jgi:photosystem II stability/assembly factor-like uncharacterized protein